MGRAPTSASWPPGWGPPPPSWPRWCTVTLATCTCTSYTSCTACTTVQVGDDEHGMAYKENLVQQGVEIRHLGVEVSCTTTSTIILSTTPTSPITHLAQAGLSTGIATIFVEGSTGENMIVIVPGANARLGAADAAAAAGEVRAARVVVGVLEVGEAALLEAFTTARSWRHRGAPGPHLARHLTIQPPSHPTPGPPG